jgi:DNA-binding SARP family transcriptional activator
VIRLRILGGTELTGENGREITTVLQQPKRLAFLSLLASGEGSRWFRRDTLLGMFWPEMNDERARGALRRTLTFLRTHLGNEAIRTRGDEVSIASDAVWCDVVACEEALRDGRLAEAVELHRGDLLSGLHVPSAPEFERWLDGTREHLRRATSDAAATLAEGAEQAGRLAEAAAWQRRALELQPDDEANLRHLLTALDRLGDRAGAIRAYEEFAARLAADLDLEPSPETAALVATLRARADATPVPMPAPAAGPASANVIAVFPFTVHGPPDIQYLREGMVDLLSTKLGGAGELRTIDPGSVLARTPQDAEPFDAARAQPIADQLGAGSFLLGSVVVDGARTLIRATLYQSGSETRVDAEGDAAVGIFEMVDDLVRQLLASQTHSLGGQLTRLGAMTTDSLPALRAYLDGERAFRGGRVRDSRAAYGAAIDRDPAFSLAHYRLATAHAACGNPVAATQAVERATAGARRLTIHARTLLAVQAALLRGALADAERHCHRLLADRPDDVEAWYRLARISLDGNRFRGRPEAEARVPLERTWALDPRHAAALADLSRLAWMTGDRQAAREYARQYLDLSADGDDAAVMGIVAGAEQISNRLTTVRRSVYGEIVALAALGAVVPDSLAPAGLGAWPSLLAAHGAAAHGDWPQAQAALDRAAQLDRELALDHEAFIATVGESQRSSIGDLVGRLRDGLADLPTASGTDPAGALRQVTRHHSLGLLSIAAGDKEGATDQARACADATVPPWAESLRAALATGIDARAALLAGNPDHALEVVTKIELGPWIHLADEVPQCGLVAERILRADALAALGREEEAWGWRTPPATLRPLEWAV